MACYLMEGRDIQRSHLAITSSSLAFGGEGTYRV